MKYPVKYQHPTECMIDEDFLQPLINKKSPMTIILWVIKWDKKRLMMIMLGICVKWGSKTRDIKHHLYLNFSPHDFCSLRCVKAFKFIYKDLHWQAVRMCNHSLTYLSNAKSISAHLLIREEWTLEMFWVNLFLILLENCLVKMSLK